MLGMMKMRISGLSDFDTEPTPYGYEKTPDGFLVCVKCGSLIFRGIVAQSGMFGHYLHNYFHEQTKNAGSLNVIG